LARKIQEVDCSTLEASERLATPEEEAALEPPPEQPPSEIELARSQLRTYRQKGFSNLSAAEKADAQNLVLTILAR
jgi:hypothetical protein